MSTKKEIVNKVKDVGDQVVKKIAHDTGIPTWGVLAIIIGKSFITAIPDPELPQNSKAFIIPYLI